MIGMKGQIMARSNAHMPDGANDVVIGDSDNK